jgi:alpha-tubulin suppressor-like RCC1 family protein
MGFLAGRWTGTQRRGLTLILAAITAALMMAIVAIAEPAQAAPNTAKAWGLNSSGQLGDGTTSGPERCGAELHACSTLPVFVSGLSGVVAMAGGGSFESSPYQYSLALLENGTVTAWGGDPGGALGDGSTGASDVPVPVCAVGATSPCSEESKQLKEVVAIAAGSEHSVALLKNGTVVAWGAIAFGGLGDGTEKTSNVPVRVCAVGTPSPKERKEKGEAPGCPGGPYLEGVTAIAAGDRFSLAVSNGTVLSWGSESTAGYLGSGSTAYTQERFAPAPVCAPGPQVPCPTGPYLTGATAVSADSIDALALLGSGKVMAWGDNFDGQLGNGTEAKSDVPVEVSGLGGATAIAAGGTLVNGGNPHMLALVGNGTVKAWGDNEFGQLGHGMTTPPGPEQCEPPFMIPCSKKPVTVSGLSKVTAIAARGNHSLAIEQGEIFAWGLNSSGELGNGTSAGPEHCFNGFSLQACSNLPVHVGNSADARGIEAGPYHSFAFGSPPAVTKVEPSRGSPGGGTTVTITGEGFTGASAVKFGSTNASFMVNSATSITAVSPAGTGTVDVTVTNTWGTSAASGADRFTYGPTVSKVEPNHGSPSGGTTVTITGTGFTGATAVKFGSANATKFTVISATSITAVSPKAMGALTVDVTVTTPAGTSPTSSADRFTYTKK